MSSTALINLNGGSENWHQHRDETHDREVPPTAGQYESESNSHRREPYSYPLTWTFSYLPLPFTLWLPRIYIPRHVATLAVKPPKPRQLSDPEAFRGDDAPVWRENRKGSDFYSCVDRETGRPALFALHMLISAKKSKNWGLPKYLRKPELPKKKKFFCMGENPGGIFNAYWQKCMDQLEALLKDFEEKFPEAVAGVKENPASFMKRGEKGTTIKIQQPLAKSDDWMYGLRDDPYYADFIQHAEIPADYKQILLPVHEKDERTGERITTIQAFAVNPAQFFDQQGDVVKLTDCPNTFADRIVELEVSLHQMRCQKSSSTSGIPRRCTIARPHAVALVDPNQLPPDQRAVQNTSISTTLSQVKHEVKEEFMEPSSSTSLDDRVQKRHVEHPINVKKEESDNEQVLFREWVSQQQSVKQETQEEYEELSTSKGERRAVIPGARAFPRVKKEHEANPVFGHQEIEEFKGYKLPTVKTRSVN